VRSAPDGQFPFPRAKTFVSLNARRKGLLRTCELSNKEKEEDLERKALRSLLLLVPLPFRLLSRFGFRVWGFGLGI